MNFTFSKNQTISFKTKTTIKWKESEKILKFNTPYYSCDIVDGKLIYRTKVGDGFKKWSELPYCTDKPSITTLTLADLEVVGDEQVYDNPAFAGFAYRVFWQQANRFYHSTEAIINPLGGFTLTESARIYDDQEIIVIF